MLKAIVIQDDKGKIEDLGDVLAIARAEGQKLFHTKRNVQVIRVFYDRDIGWVAVIKYEDRVRASGVRGGERK